MSSGRPVNDVFLSFSIAVKLREAGYQKSFGYVSLHSMLEFNGYLGHDLSLYC